ncbi:uncharacterized protein LOC113239873 isoform X1 [Hyposmocoma kahamanoa]|uniref:uncharacterized protein LOC113239873 isoform X1 n=1 Tax=Hyposmocoma kahamanoa TaxID=1477025 RepID=UPI000E6D72E8|nr:uncharacterized protein LOC113239873 isoform X1 [Hyposmocoma kahamanoa]
MTLSQELLRLCLGSTCAMFAVEKIMHVNVSVGFNSLLCMCYWEQRISQRVKEAANISLLILSAAMRMHFYGLIYLIYHISYMFGYVGGENAIRCPIGINSTGFDVERIFNESTRWHSQKEGRLFATVFTRRNTQTKLNSSI